MEGCVNRVHRIDRNERVAVGARTNDRFNRDIAGSARPVLDDELLAKPLRQPLTDQPRYNVGIPASGKANDPPYRPRWIGLRPSETRHSWQRGSAGGQMQKSTTGNFHGVLLTKRMPTVCPENSIGTPAGCVGMMLPLWDDG